VNCASIFDVCNGWPGVADWLFADCSGQKNSFRMSFTPFSNDEENMKPYFRLWGWGGDYELPKLIRHKKWAMEIPITH